MTDSFWMLRAIQLAKATREAGDPPYAAIVLDENGREIAAAGNTVRSDRLTTRHAEINAIEAAQRALGRRDLSGCTLVSSAEPCPMCAGAIHWAGLSALVFGASIPSIKAMTAGGHRQIPIRAATVLEQTACEVRGPVAEAMALDLFV
ncbi:MAG: nucleoside deaminase [Pseudomonadota bacterium]